MTSNAVRTISVGAAALVLFAGSMFAQPAGPQGPDRPMRGPRVEQNRPPHLEERFTQEAGRSTGLQRPTPHHEYMSVIWMLRDEEAPDSLRLTTEQEGKIAALDREFQQSMREHMEKVRELARRDRPGGGAAPPAPAAAPPEGRPRPAREGAEGEREGRRAEDDGERRGGPPAPPVPPAPRRITEAERERMEELRRNAPRPTDAQTKIWNELTDVQQAFVQDELQERRRIAEARRDQEMMRRRMAFRDGGEGVRGGERPGDGPGRFGSPEAQAQRQRLGRALQQLQQLPQEERERIFQVLEAELERAAIAYPHIVQGEEMGAWGVWRGDRSSGGGARGGVAAEGEERQRRIQRWRERRSGEESRQRDDSDPR